MVNTTIKGDDHLCKPCKTKRSMFELLGDYSGVVLLELRPRYGGFLPEILENARRLCAKAAARTAPGV